MGGSGFFGLSPDTPTRPIPLRRSGRGMLKGSPASVNPLVGKGGKKREWIPHPPGFSSFRADRLLADASGPLVGGAQERYNEFVRLSRAGQAQSQLLAGFS